MRSDPSVDAAFPLPAINHGKGFSKKEYAAIMLRVPASGTDWLDEMIRRSHCMVPLTTEVRNK